MKIEDEALRLVHDGDVVGLGSGRAATAFIQALGERVRQGLRVRGVPTSQKSAEVARPFGIPLITLNDVEQLDIAVDGADEVDPRNNLIKGLGGALVREKLVASAARRFVVLVGREKIVPVLGSHGVLPVEVVPFGISPCRRRLEKLGLPSRQRLLNGAPFVSDNGNFILDCQVGPLADPAALEARIREIPGLVDTGLFLGMSPVLFIQDGDRVESRGTTGSGSGG
jgi:ribose 5-phosphate isomerase A